jgi:hypothetical protein
MRRLLLLLSILTLASCASAPLPERVDLASGVVEIPSTQTFDPKELPAGVETSDVLQIISIDTTTSKRTVLMPVHTPSGRIFVLKNNRVVAGKGAAAMVKSVETVRRSWAWLWWTLGILAAVIATSRSLERFKNLFKRG